MMKEITLAEFSSYNTRRKLDVQAMHEEAHLVFQVSLALCKETPLYARFHAVEGKFISSDPSVIWKTLHVDRSLHNLLNLGFHKLDTNFSDFLTYIRNNNCNKITILSGEEKVRMLTLEEI